jgi:hypothetical protein
MKTLALLFLSFTLPGSSFAPAPRFPVQAEKVKAARKGGTWYFAENGHAVYCYGPVMYLRDVQGSLTRVATFCQGDKPIVPLKD